MSDLAVTPAQTIGPFFNFALPYDRCYELVPPATPGATRLHGTVYDGRGVPIPDALVEVRQADPEGNIPRVEGALRRDGTAFTGWGRSLTDFGGHYSFTTVEPGAVEGGAPFFAITLFARGLVERQFTRAYLPGASDSFLDGLDAVDRAALTAARDADGSLRFDIHMQGEKETPFLAFPGHGR